MLIDLFNDSYLSDTGSSESDYDSNNIDSKLELKELGNAVVYIPPPHDCLHDAAKVIICENDVWRLLSHICSSYTLKEQK